MRTRRIVDCTWPNEPFLTLGFTMPVNAVPIGITLTNSPDILVDSLSISYLHIGANANPFTATGTAEQLDAAAITGGVFNLTATLDNAGNFVSGNFSVTGSVATNGPSLLSGTLQNFGFSIEADTVDFLFSVVSGDLATLYGGVGATGGIVISQAGLPAAFPQSFANTDGASIGHVGILATPEPATGGPLLTGMTALRMVRAWRRRRHGGA